jgi:hypothetical protein
LSEPKYCPTARPRSQRSKEGGDGGGRGIEIVSYRFPSSATDRAEQAVWFCYLRAIKSVLDAEQAPTPWNALQLVFAAILKFNARANHEVLDGARDKDLVR